MLISPICLEEVCADLIYIKHEIHDEGYVQQEFLMWEIHFFSENDPEMTCMQKRGPEVTSKYGWKFLYNESQQRYSQI